MRKVLSLLLIAGCATDADTDTDVATDVDSDVFAHTTETPGRTAWAYRADGTGDAHVAEVLRDHGGYGAWIAGTFTGALAYDIVDLQATGARGDIFLIPVTPTGDADRGLVFGGPDHDEALELRRMGADLALLSSSHNDGSGGIDFGCDGVAAPDGYVLQLTRLGVNGGCVWTKTVDHNQGNLYFPNLATDRNGNVVLAITWEGTIVVDGLSLRSGNLGSEADLVVVKFDGAGNRLWWRRFSASAGTTGPNVGVHAYDVAIDGNGYIGVTGVFRGQMDFGGGVMDDQNGGYLLRLTPGGAYSWLREIGPAGNPKHLAAGGTSGTFAVTGTFSDGTVDFGATSVTTPFPSLDTWVVKYDASGNDMWSRHLWGTSDWTEPHGIAIDHHGTVFVTGEFSNGSLNIGAHRWETDGAGMFVAALSPLRGRTTWARGVLGGARPEDLDVTANSRAIVGGFLFGPADLGTGTITPSGTDGFVARFLP